MHSRPRLRPLLVKTIFAAALILVATHAEAGPADAMNGTWVNADSESNGVIRMVIADGNTIRLFGKCSPNPCDWGSVPLTTYGSGVTDDTHERGTANYQFSYKMVSVAIEQVSINRIDLENFNRFTDTSGRQNYFRKEQFRRATPLDDGRPFWAQTSEPND